MSTEIDPALLKILACPEDKGSVLYVAGEWIYVSTRLIPSVMVFPSC